jgi:hypothetical protein
MSDPENHDPDDAQVSRNVTYMGTCAGNTLRDLADDVDAGRVTHAVACYRDEDGNLNYRCIGEDHITYLVGMLARVAMSLGGPE